MANSANLKKPKGEDIFECFLYPKCCLITNPDEISENLLLEEIKKFKEKIAEFTNDYIWHRDELVFQPRTKNSLLFEATFEGISNGKKTNIFLPRKNLIIFT